MAILTPTIGDRDSKEILYRVLTSLDTTFDIKAKINAEYNINVIFT
jgi:hypothetical protein